MSMSQISFIFKFVINKYFKYKNYNITHNIYYSHVQLKVLNLSNVNMPARQHNNKMLDKYSLTRYMIHKTINKIYKTH